MLTAVYDRNPSERKQHRRISCSGVEALCISLPSGHDSSLPDYNTVPERYRTGFYTVVMHLGENRADGTDIKRHMLMCGAGLCLLFGRPV